MSKPFADLIEGPLSLRVLAGCAFVLTLAACGSSTQPRADAEKPLETVAPTVARAAPAAVEPTASAEPASRRDRRSGRRASEETATDATAAAPIPEEAAAAYQRALAAMRADSWLEAELELEQLTVAQPSYPGPHVNLALVYLHDGRRADARAALERALVIEPGHASANTQLGILLREDGKFSEAEEAYRRALATDPEHALAHYNLGVLLDVYLRRTAEALEHYEHYQASLTEPNETVGRWIIDLRRRVGNGEAARVAQEDSR